MQKGQEELQRCDAILAAEPDNAEAHYRRGNALFALKRVEEALASYDRALAIKPDAAEALNNRGNVLATLKRLGEALASYERALAIRPAYPDALNNRGNVLKDLGRLEEALAAYDQALAIAPDFAEALSNRGHVLCELNRIDEAVVSYSKAIAVRPDHAEARNSRGVANLLQGAFAAGWRDYEGRYDRADAPRRTLTASFPFWRGEELEGKSIVVYDEQGMGDIIQFVRYLDRLSALGARVTFLVRPGLHRLLRASFPGVAIVDRLPPRQVFDFQSALLSLPGAFETSLDTIPADVPYLVPEAVLVAQWRQRVGEHGLKIGVAWQGNPAHKADATRSFPLRYLEPLAKIPAVRLIALQKNAGVDAIAELGGAFKVETFADELDAGPDAFVDTAAILASLDLVVTADTALAHLAGAMGRPVWLALPHVPDWRWLTRRTDSPWYPTAVLYRQSMRGDWPGVFAAMARDLAQRLQDGRAAPAPLQVPIGVGELFDKITILEIKAARIADPDKRGHVSHELALLREIEDRLTPPGADEDSVVAELRRVNETLWDVEDAIRGCEARQDFGEAFIALARSVYRHNDRRAELKKRLNVLHGSEIVEEKSYAASEAAAPQPAPRLEGKRP